MSPDGACRRDFKFRSFGNNMLGVETVAGYELRLPIHSWQRYDFFL
jgi:hypothetical protein